MGGELQAIGIQTSKIERRGLTLRKAITWFAIAAVVAGLVLVPQWTTNSSTLSLLFLIFVISR